MAKMIFGSSKANSMIHKMQSQRKMSVHKAWSVTVAQLCDVTETGHGREDYRIMDCVYQQWEKIDGLLTDIFQQINTGVKLCGKLCKEAWGKEDTPEIQQIWADRLTVSDRCYALANRYIAGDKAFWEFKQNMLTIGSDPDKLQEAVDAIKADPNWGIPAFLLDENVPVPGNFIPEEDPVGFAPDSLSAEQCKKETAAAKIVTEEFSVAVKEEAKVNNNEVLESAQQAIFDIKKSTGIFSFLSKKVSAAADTVVSAATAVVTKVKAVAATVVNTVVNTVTAVKNTVSNFFGLVGSAFSNLFSSTTV